MFRGAHGGVERNARARRRMSGVFSKVWKGMRELSKPSGSLSFTSRRTSNSSNHDVHLHHGGADVSPPAPPHCTALPRSLVMADGMCMLHFVMKLLQPINNVLSCFCVVCCIYMLDSIGFGHARGDHAPLRRTANPGRRHSQHGLKLINAVITLPYYSFSSNPKCWFNIM